MTMVAAQIRIPKRQHGVFVENRWSSDPLACARGSDRIPDWREISRYTLTDPRTQQMGQMTHPAADLRVA